MQHDDRTETRFLGAFYGLIALILAVTILVALAGAHLLSLALIIVPLFVAMGMLWYGIPHDRHQPH